MAAATTTTHIRWCAAATASCRSISMYRAAHPPRKRCYTASFSCRRRSSDSGYSRAEARGLLSRAGLSDAAMTQALKELGDHIAASLGDDVLGSSIAHGQLMLRVRRETVV